MMHNINSVLLEKECTRRRLILQRDLYWMENSLLLEIDNMVYDDMKTLKLVSAVQRKPWWYVLKCMLLCVRLQNVTQCDIFSRIINISSLNKFSEITMCAINKRSVFSFFMRFSIVRSSFMTLLLHNKKEIRQMGVKKICNMNERANDISYYYKKMDWVLEKKV